MFIFPTENVSFREGNPLCAGCRMPDYAAKAIYKVHFKTSKIYRQGVEKSLHNFKQDIYK